MQHSKWIALGFSAFCLIAVAAVLRAQHLYYMAAILLCLPGVSYLMGWYALHGLEFTRELPGTLWEGQEESIRYVVTNRSRVARYFLTIHEHFPEWIVPPDEEPALFNVDAEGATTLLQPLAFHKRGVYSVDSFVITATDPLGVFAFSKRVPCAGEIVVYPQAGDLDTIPMSGADRFGWQEFVSVLLHGASVDPDGVRPYVSGDPLRYIHWRQTAKSGKLSVIEFEEAQAVNLVILLDAKRGTNIGKGKNTTLEYAVRVAAAVAEAAINLGATVQLIVPRDALNGESGQSHVAASRRSVTLLYSIMDTLARVEAESRVSIGQLLLDEVVNTPPGTSLLVITSDPDPGLADTLLGFAAAGAHIDAVYIDPSTFVSGDTGVSNTGRVVAALLAASGNVYLVECDPAGRILPKETLHARQRA